MPLFANFWVDCRQIPPHSPYFRTEMDASLSPEYEFMPSTLEHRPLHTQEKVALKAYFLTSGENEFEGYSKSAYATSEALANLEAWAWGLRLWGRECHVRATAAATALLADTWEAHLIHADNDPVPMAAVHSHILSPREAVSGAMYWANIPGEKKAYQLLERIKPLPKDWEQASFHEALLEKPFIWGAMAGFALLNAVYDKRDEAGTACAIAFSGAARALMTTGIPEIEAIETVRKRVIAELREWMGYKW